MGNFSKRTLERRRSKIPDMLEAHRNGKTAFMVMYQLVIFDKTQNHRQVFWMTQMMKSL